MRTVLLSALFVVVGVQGIHVARAAETKNAEVRAVGVLQAIDRPGARVKIDHGPIKSIGMPAMVMTFKVRDPALLAELKEGDQVDFALERSGLGWVVVRLSKK